MQDSSDPWVERVAATTRRIHAAEAERKAAREARAALAREMHAAGMSWPEVGRRLGITHQRAQQIAKAEGARL